MTQSYQNSTKEVLVLVHIYTLGNCLKKRGRSTMFLYARVRRERGGKCIGIRWRRPRNRKKGKESCWPCCNQVEPSTHGGSTLEQLGAVASLFSGGCVRKKKLGYTLHVRLPHRRKDMDRTEDATLENYSCAAFF